MSRAIVDTEANGLLEEADQIWCMCTHDVDTGERYTFVHPAYITLFHSNGTLADGFNYLSRLDEVIIHNGIGYDIPLWEKIEGFTLPASVRVTDTLILSKLAHHDRRMVAGCKSGPHSVEAWGIRFGRSKPEHEDWSKLSGEMIHRCQEDVEIQTMIYSSVLREMQIAGSWDFAIWLEHEFAKIIQRQNHKGWTFDVEGAKEKVQYLTTYMEELHSQVAPYLPYVVKDEKEIKKPLLKAGGWSKPTLVWAQSMFGEDVRPDGPDHIILRGVRYNWSIAGHFHRVDFPKLNIGSDTQLKPWLMNSLGWRPTEWNIDKKTRKPKSPKLSEDSLDSLTVGIGPAIAQWLKCKHRRSMIEGWLKKVRIDGTIMAPSNALGTPTGRQTHKVIVNVPSEDAYFGKECRSLFIAKPGRVIVGGDSASCQARMLCHRMGDERFTEAVINGDKDKGTDIHTFNMNMTGVPNRKLAKNFFYGFIFGAQAAKVGSIIGKGKKEGQKIIDNYFDNLPLLKELITGLTHYWSQNGHIIGMDGRVIHPRAKHECLCYDLQLGEAISVKLAAILVGHWAHAEALDHELLICMHDELNYDVLPEHADRFGQLLKLSFQEAGRIMNLTVPLDGEVKQGYNWGDVH
jgi:DNA polymerase-1